MTACKNREFPFCFLFFPLTRQRWAKSILHINVYVETKYTRIVHISLTIATHLDVESHTSAHIDKNEFELEMNEPNQMNEKRHNRFHGFNGLCLLISDRRLFATVLFSFCCVVLSLWCISLVLWCSFRWLAHTTSPWTTVHFCCAAFFSPSDKKVNG